MSSKLKKAATTSGVSFARDTTDNSFNDAPSSSILKGSKHPLFLFRVPKDMDMSSLNGLKFDMSGSAVKFEDGGKNYKLGFDKKSPVDKLVRPITLDAAIGAASIGKEFSGSIQVTQFFSIKSVEPDAAPVVSISISRMMTQSLFAIIWHDVFAM